jgi:hypothetical protein
VAVVRAVLGSFAVVFTPVLLIWAIAGQDRAPWAGAFRIAVDIWLLTQHTGIAIPDGHLGLTPLGLALVPIMACGLSARRLARVLDARERSPLPGADPAWLSLRALVLFAGGYAAASGILAWWVATAQARPIVPQAVLATGTLALASGAGGMLSFRFGGWRSLPAAIAELIPAFLARVLSSVGIALGVHLLASTILFIGVVAAGYDRVATLHQALHPDLAGGVLLVLGQVLLTPNLVIWVGSVLAGPGFAIGTGSAVTVHEVTLGPLPALPVLGALPSPGTMPPWTVALLMVPVIAGIVAGVRLLRDGGIPWWRLPVDAAAVAVLSGLAMTVLAWLSAGPAGPGRLARTGPQAVPVGLWFAAEIAVGLVLVLLVLRGVPALYRWVRRGLPPSLRGGRRTSERS